jgi:hypothetical protein
MWLVPARLEQPAAQNWRCVGQTNGRRTNTDRAAITGNPARSWQLDKVVRSKAPCPPLSLDPRKKLLEKIQKVHHEYLTPLDNCLDHCVEYSRHLGCWVLLHEVRKVAPSTT